MSDASASHSADLERTELETVLAALVRNPRLATLLRYLAEKTFQGQSSDICEYNIAIEVFGRSKKSFDNSRDAIARVEAHRLRKRLKEYYQAEGKDHQISISLPAGSYVPVFTRRNPAPQMARIEAHSILAADSIAAPVATAPNPTGADPSEPLPQQTAQDKAADPISDDQEPDDRESDAHRTQSPAQVSTHPAPSPRARKLIPLYAAIAALLLVASVLGFFWRGRSASLQTAADAGPAKQGLSPTPANAAKVPLRLLAGYTGSPRVDSAGAYWEADRYFKGGAGYRRPEESISRTSDPMLFENWRAGDFEYNIPLAPGPYELHLFFVAAREEDISPDTFHVTTNWAPLLPSFSISADALGAHIADERVFRDIYPTRWGYLQLGFASERASAVLSAIELLPGIPHRQLPIRLVMQKTAVTDKDGNLWHPDNYFQNGRLSDVPRVVSGAPDANLYAHERYGHFTYSIPVDSRDAYTVVLRFAEMFWGPQASGQGGAGSRVFRVICNGSTLLDNLDLFKEAGSLHAVTKAFHHLHPTAEGKLNLTFEPIANFATVSAIEVIDESE